MLRRSTLLLLVLIGCSRSPRALAERFSGFPLRAETVEFVEEASGFADSDLYVKVVLQFSAPDFDRLVSQADAAGFWNVDLPVEPVPVDAGCETLAIELAGRGSRVLLRTESDSPSDCRVTTLSYESRRLTVVRLVQ